MRHLTEERYVSISIFATSEYVGLVGLTIGTPAKLKDPSAKGWRHDFMLAPHEATQLAKELLEWTETATSMNSRSTLARQEATMAAKKKPAKRTSTKKTKAVKANAPRTGKKAAKKTTPA
jgi:hypothetical protein